jgi:hypothetical protein
MIGLDPQSIYWIENPWWEKPRYAKYGPRLLTIPIVQQVFDKKWCKKYFQECLKDAERTIAELRDATNPLAKAYMELHRTAKTDVEKYLTSLHLIPNHHPFFQDMRGEGQYVLDHLLQLSESLNAVSGHHNFKEILSRLRRRSEYESTLAEITFAKMTQDKGIRIDPKGPSKNPKRNCDYLCFHEGSELGVEITRIESIKKREILAPVIEFLFRQLVMNQGLTLENFILYIDNVDAKDNIEIIISKVKEIESKILKDGIPKYGTFPIYNFGRLLVDSRQPNSINGQTVSEVYDNEPESRKIESVLLEKEDQFPAHIDSILVVFSPRSFFPDENRTKIHFPKGRKILGILDVKQYIAPSLGLQTEMTLLRNPDYQSENPILQKILSGSRKISLGE